MEAWASACVAVMIIPRLDQTIRLFFAFSVLSCILDRVSSPLFRGEYMGCQYAELLSDTNKIPRFKLLFLAAKRTGIENYNFRKNIPTLYAPKHRILYLLLLRAGHIRANARNGA